MLPISHDNVNSVWRSNPAEATSSQIYKESVHSHSKYAPLNTTCNDENAFLREELEHLPHRHVPIREFIDAVMDSSMYNEQLEGAKKSVGTKIFKQYLDDYISPPVSVDPTRSFERLVQHILSPTGSNDGEIHYLRTSDAPLAGSSANTKRTPTGVLFRSEPEVDLVPPTWSHVLVPFEFRDPNSSRDPASAQSSMDPHNLHDTGLMSSPPLNFDGMGRLILNSRPRLREPRPLKRPRADDDADDQSRISAPVGKKMKDNEGNALAQSTFRDGPVGPEEKPVILTDRERLAASALEVMSVFGDRRFVLGALVDGAQIEIWYFDRSGGIASTPFELNTCPELFVAFVQGLAHVTPEQLGYEPVIHKDSNALDHVGTDNASIALHGDFYTIKETLCIPRGLCGRGTVVFRVNKDGTQQEYAAKLSWQLRSGTAEHDLITKLRAVESHHIDGTPIVHDAMDYATLCDGLRGRLHKHLRNTKNLDRVLRVIIISPLCEPISEVRDILEFKKAFISLVKCHHDLYLRAKVLHGDINVDNLMVRCDDHSRGILIDWDMAMSIDELGVPSAPKCDDNHSGCLPFLAIDLMQSPERPHFYRHDLESFFWCLIWLVNDNNDSGLLNKWHNGSWKDICDAKTGFLSTYIGLQACSHRFTELRPWLDGLIPLFQLAYQGLFNHIRDLTIYKNRANKGPQYDIRTLGGLITYDNIIKILES